MQYDGVFLRISRTVMLLAIALFIFMGSRAKAQPTRTPAIPDAQIEANVLKALANAPQLTNENIITNTIDGTVTLSGTVKDEPTRQMAETLAAKAVGVQKVVDELTLSTERSGSFQNPSSMSSSEDASAPLSEQGQQHAPDPDTYAVQHGLDPETGQPISPVPADSAAGNQSVGTPDEATTQGVPDYDGQPQQGNSGSQSYPQPRYPRQRRDTPPPYGAQVAGQPITVPAGSLLRIRINEGLDSQHTQPGTQFDAIVLNDVVADGAVAIPRGADVRGIVVDAKSGGAIKGRGELYLQLTQVILGGKAFPIDTDVWSRSSVDKTGQTVGSAVGLGAFGALVGAVAGGGPGAAIGAVAGGAAGIGSSAASGRRQVVIPSEAILTFHLAQPAPMVTISQAEMDRLSYGVPAGASPRMRQRYAPPPPPYYYGPGYYSRPY